jgi:hypothetical protein
MSLSPHLEVTEMCRVVGCMKAGDAIRGVRKEWTTVYLPSSEAAVNSRASVRLAPNPTRVKRKVAEKDPTARRTLPNSTQTVLVSPQRFD